jgi:hypothetical protein
LEGSARATLAQLQSDTATVSVLGTRAGPASLEVEVTVRNMTGHKFPTAYPSRRAWLQVTVSDRDGRLLFESGTVGRTGAIHGNDNDVDPGRYEAHHDVFRRPEDVQIYESILVDASGAVTTGLLRGASFVKDNRLLPRGFDKVTAGSDTAVRGGASTDENFAAGADRVRYLVATEGAQGPFNVDVELRYQPISFRWAHNLTSYDADEPRRFVTYYESMAAQSSALISRAGTRVP